MKHRCFGLFAQGQDEPMTKSRLKLIVLRMQTIVSKKTSWPITSVPQNPHQCASVPHRDTQNDSRKVSVMLCP